MLDAGGRTRLKIEKFARKQKAAAAKRRRRGGSIRATSSRETRSTRDPPTSIYLACSGAAHTSRESIARPIRGCLISGHSERVPTRLTDRCFGEHVVLSRARTPRPQQPRTPAPAHEGGGWRCTAGTTGAESGPPSDRPSWGRMDDDFKRRSRRRRRSRLRPAARSPRPGEST